MIVLWEYFSHLFKQVLIFNILRTYGVKRISHFMWYCCVNKVEYLIMLLYLYKLYCISNFNELYHSCSLIFFIQVCHLYLIEFVLFWYFLKHFKLDLAWIYSHQINYAELIRLIILFSWIWLKFKELKHFSFG